MPVTALPASAPVNTIVSVHVTDPPPTPVDEVRVLADVKVRLLVDPVTERLPFRETASGNAEQAPPAGLTAISASVPVVDAVPVTVVPDVGNRSVNVSEPFSVRVERQTIAPVLVVTIICPLKVPLKVLVGVDGLVEESHATPKAATSAIAHADANRIRIHYWTQPRDDAT